MGFIQQRQNEPNEATGSAIEVGIGVFPQTLRDNFRLYYGARLGYVRTKQEEDESVPPVTLTQTQKADGYFVAPTSAGNTCWGIDSVSERKFSFDTHLSKGESSLQSDDTLPRGIALPPPRNWKQPRRLRVFSLFRGSTFDTSR